MSAETDRATVPADGGAGGADTRNAARTFARSKASAAVEAIERIMSGQGGRGAMAQLVAAKQLLEIAFGAQFEADTERDKPEGEQEPVKVIPQEEAVRHARTLRLAELAERKRAG